MLLSLPSSVEVPSPISNAERRARQDRLVEGFGPDHLIILSNPPLRTRSNDVHHPYRSHSDLLYFVGWRQPGAVFVMSHESGSWVRHLFVPARDVEREIWDGRRPGLEGALEAFPIDVAHDIEDLESVLTAFLSNSRVAVTRLGVLPKVDRIVESALKAQSRDKQRYGQGPESVIDPTVRIGELRLIKSPAEIALMRHAAEITSLAHIEAMRHGGPTTGERQLQAILEGTFLALGGDQWAYPSIVGSGVNATILHYIENDAECRSGDVVLIDAGAEYRGYAADITRSWPIDGRFTEAQREIYELVLKAQQEAIEACVAGQPYDAPHEAARRTLAQGLIDLGIIEQDVATALNGDAGDLRRWYMHNTSHWLGLDVHDVGVYRPQGAPRLLEPGMVLTVEPGLYFGAWRPDVEVPSRYADLGIRIEDDVLVTDGEPEVLTERCPRDPDTIESIVGTA